MDYITCNMANSKGGGGFNVNLSGHLVYYSCIVCILGGMI